MHRYIQSFSSPTIKGWLMKKARTGLRKTWIRRYFVLESQQLRCYKDNQEDSLPISTFDLREYQLQNQSSTKPFTFQLIHQSSSKSSTTPLSTTLPSPDLYLQAENEKEWSNWVDTLERHVGDQQHMMTNGSTDNTNDIFDYHLDDDDKVDVLDKWLERYDLIVPRNERCTSSLLSLAPSSNYDMNGDDVDDDNDSDLEDMSRRQQQSTNPPRTSTTEKLSQSIKPSSSSSTPKTSSSSPRFLGFLWTMSSKRSKTPSDGSSSSSSSSSNGGIH